MVMPLRDFNVWMVTPEGTLWQKGSMRSKSEAKLRASLRWHWKGRMLEALKDRDAKAKEVDQMERALRDAREELAELEARVDQCRWKDVVIVPSDEDDGRYKHGAVYRAADKDADPSGVPGDGDRGALGSDRVRGDGVHPGLPGGRMEE